MLLGSMHTNIDWWDTRSLPDNTMHVHEHELKRGEGHPLWVIVFIVLHHSAALPACSRTALQTPCCIHAGVCAGWRTKFSCYLLCVSLPLSLDRGAQRKVQSAFAHQAIIPPHRKLHHTALHAALHLIIKLFVTLENISVSKNDFAAGIEALHQALTHQCQLASVPFTNSMDVPLTSHASQIHPERFITASADAEVEAMAGYACCTLRSDDGPRTHGRQDAC